VPNKRTLLYGAERYMQETNDHDSQKNSIAFPTEPAGPAGSGGSGGAQPGAPAGESALATSFPVTAPGTLSGGVDDRGAGAINTGGTTGEGSRQRGSTAAGEVQRGPAARIPSPGAAAGGGIPYGRDAQSYRGPLLEDAAYSYFESERTHAPEDFYLDTAEHLLHLDAVEGIRDTLARVALNALQGRVDLNVLGQALKAPVRFTHTLPSDEPVNTFINKRTGEIHGIAFNVRYELLPEELAYLLLHELRHVMQHLSDVNIVPQPGVNYWADPVEIDADQFAQAVSGFPRPNDMSRPISQKAPLPRDPGIAGTPMRLPGTTRYAASHSEAEEYLRYLLPKVLDPLNGNPAIRLFPT